MELSEEKSQQLASVLQVLNIYITSIDAEYLKATVKGMFQQAQTEQTLAPLNRSYNPHKADLIGTSAQALEYLGLYIDELKKVTEIKKHIGEYETVQGEISKMFL